jgi:hypothetical protein
MAVHSPDHPFARFRDVFEALNRERGWFESATYLRFAAIAALCCEGSPSSVAGRIRDVAQQLKKKSGWFDNLRSELRFVVAAILTLHDDDTTEFINEIDRVRKLFRQVDLRRDSTYEMLTILVLRSGLNQGTIDLAAVQRVKGVYEEMKKYQWWLTGPDDLPACALLALRDEAVGLMGQRIDQIYAGLRKEGLWHCNELQSSANLLYLAEGRAELAVSRAGELIRQFKTRGQIIRRTEYDEIAILSFLLNEPAEIIDRVLSYRDQIRELKPRPDKRLALNLGSNIAFLDFMRFDDDLLSVSQIKLIVDVQAVVAAQRAAAAIIAAQAGG